MKKIIVVFLIIHLLSIGQNSAIDILLYENLLIKNGTYYKKGADSIINGEFIIKRVISIDEYDRRLRISKGKFENGKKEGLWSEWHENGQKKADKKYESGTKIKL